MAFRPEKWAMVVELEGKNWKRREGPFACGDTSLFAFSLTRPTDFNNSKKKKYFFKHRHLFLLCRSSFCQPSCLSRKRMAWRNADRKTYNIFSFSEPRFLPLYFASELGKKKHLSSTKGNKYCFYFYCLNCISIFCYRWYLYRRGQICHFLSDFSFLRFSLQH